MKKTIAVVLAIICGGCASTQHEDSYWHNSTTYKSGGRCETLEDCRPPVIEHESKGVFSSAEEVVAVATADAIATNSRANLITAQAHAAYLSSYGGAASGIVHSPGSPVPGVGMLHDGPPDGAPVTRLIKFKNQTGGYVRVAVNGMPVSGVIPPEDRSVYLVSTHPTRTTLNFCVQESLGGAVNGVGRTTVRLRRDKARSFRFTRFHVRTSTRCSF